MKSILTKLTMAGLLMAGIFILAPQVAPRVNYLFTPPVVHQAKPVIPPPGVRYLERVEDLVFDITNQARRARGLAPLSKDDELRKVARAYSDDMLVRRFFDHTNPDGVPFDERITDQYPQRVYFVGENIWFADGYNTANAPRLAQEIVADWMSSPSHRDNLLDPDYTHLGVGVSARHQKIRATQEFVKRPKAFSFRGLMAPDRG
jgi:uncharacterized protein YkwD